MMDKNNTPQSASSWNAADARMSFFTKPITNKWPTAEPVSLFQVYQYVHTRRYLPETRDLRAIDDDDKARQYKGQHLDYITPSGIFSYCSDTSLVCHSSILCMDLDDLGESVEKLFELLIHDPMFETLLLFRSPRGQGLKWFIHIDLTRCDHRTWFQAIRNYLMHTYHLEDKQVDKACGNPSRACYLCHDSKAYLPLSLIEYF
jgi:hypothetical protein